MNSKNKNQMGVCTNRKAWHNYNILESFEVGIVLLGLEVKSVRSNNVSIADSYAVEKKGEIYLVNSYIENYKFNNQITKYNSRRDRKLLLHKKDINKLIGKLKQQSITLVPLRTYFNKRNKLKIELAIASGKKLHDKRADIKEREWKIQKARISKNNY